MNSNTQKPTAAFVGASWLALFIGAITYLAGLWNAQMQIVEKGFYLTILLYGLFSAVSLQKSVRDRLEEVPVTNIYFGLCWLSLGLALLLLTVGLWHATMSLSEKCFYAMAYLLSLFAAVAVQKNVRDLTLFDADSPKTDKALKIKPPIDLKKPAEKTNHGLHG